jgi:hypothetical protein
MAELSPAAQAVFWAFNSKFDWIEDGVPGPQFKAIAAALRVAADHVVPEPPMIVEGGRTYEEAWTATVHGDIRRQLLAIAAELEALPND